MFLWCIHGKDRHISVKLNARLSSISSQYSGLIAALIVGVGNGISFRLFPQSNHWMNCIRKLFTSKSVDGFVHQSSLCENMTYDVRANFLQSSALQDMLFYDRKFRHHPRYRIQRASLLKLIIFKIKLSPFLSVSFTSKWSCNKILALIQCIGRSCHVSIRIVWITNQFQPFINPAVVFYCDLQNFTFWVSLYCIFLPALSCIALWCPAKKYIERYCHILPCSGQK